jgi:hypothetical protein
VIRRGAIGLAACAALLVSACGGGGGGNDELASLAPPSAAFYTESVVRPEGEQRDAIESLASRVGGIHDPGGAITKRLDAELSGSGVDATYDDDIAPWLGGRGAVLVQSFGGNPPPFAAMFETTDTEAAQDFLDKVKAATPSVKESTYNGVQYLEAADPSGGVGIGLVDDFLVFGTIDAFKAAVDASKGDSLADSGAFETGTSSLPSDNLALGYADGEQAARALARIPVDPLQATVLKGALQTLATGPVTFAVSATRDTATFDLSLPSSVGVAGGDLVGRAPANSWFAIGLQNLGSILGNALAAADLLQLSSTADEIRRATGVDPKHAASWMNNGYASVAGTSEKTIHIGAVVGSSDTKASSKDIAAAKKRVEADADAKLSPPRVQGADTGFSAVAPESPQAIDVAQIGAQVVAALGPGRPGEEELHPKNPLSGDATFNSALEALGSDFPPVAWVSLQPFFVVAEKGGSATDPGYLAAKPYLEKLDYLIAGATAAEGRTAIRLAVGVK